MKWKYFIPIVIAFALVTVYAWNFHEQTSNPFKIVEVREEYIEIQNTSSETFYDVKIIVVYEKVEKVISEKDEQTFTTEITIGPTSEAIVVPVWKTGETLGFECYLPSNELIIQFDGKTQRLKV